jgi:hypothetical protein
MMESWVKMMELRLVGAELDKCHKAEGVNHYENCKWLAEKYLHKLRENRVCCFHISPACVLLLLVDPDAFVGEGI